MQGHEHFGNQETLNTNTSNEEYVYPDFEQHMQELTARENSKKGLNNTEMPASIEADGVDENNAESESILANNPFSLYFNYETSLKENNEKFGESFTKLNESVYGEYDKASEDALNSDREYYKYGSIFNVYGTDRESNTRHYYVREGGGKTREIVTPMRINVGLDGKVANRDEFDPESLELYEDLRAKETEAYVKSSMDKQKEMQLLIQLNILNNGFTNHGMENSTISTRNDMPSYQDAIKDKLALDGDEAVIPPNPNGELSLTEYIDGVAESYDDMANEAATDLKELESKLGKVSDTYFHSKNPIRSLIAGRKYRKMQSKYSSLLKELKTINLYRSAADDLQQRLQ